MKSPPRGCHLPHMMGLQTNELLTVTKFYRQFTAWLSPEACKVNSQGLGPPLDTTTPMNVSHVQALITPRLTVNLYLLPLMSDPSNSVCMLYTSTCTVYMFTCMCILLRECCSLRNYLGVSGSFQVALFRLVPETCDWWDTATRGINSGFSCPKGSGAGYSEGS